MFVWMLSIPVNNFSVMVGMFACLPGLTQYKAEDKVSCLRKQEGQLALNRSPEFWVTLTYRYLMKARHVPGDTLGRAYFGPRGMI